MKKISLFAMVTLLGVILVISFSSASFAEKPIQLRWGSVMVIKTLDPKDQTGDPDYIAAENLYDTLVYPDTEKVYIPWVADSWKISTDGLKYKFSLKKGIPFHDGTELTAEDVAFSMDRMVTMGGNVSTYFKTIKPGTSKVLDKYTVEFNLKSRDPAFMVSLFLFKILNKKQIMANLADGKYGEYKDYGAKYLQRNEAGSGPFELIEHKHGDYVKMKRFKKYSLREIQANSAELATIYMIPEVVTLATKLKKGDLDIAHWALPVKVQRGLQKNKNFIVSEDYMPKPWIVVMNNSKKPLDDLYVRQAINYAFRKDVVTGQILAGGKPLKGPLPEELRGGCTDIKSYPFDLEKAKAALKKSKYTSEQLKSFKMEFAAVSGSERFKKIGLLFCSDMKKIGIDVQMKPVRWADICQAARKKETAYEFSLLAQAAKMPHPLQFLMFYTPRGQGVGYPSGGMNYSNPEVTEAVEKGNNSSDVEGQRKYYCIAQKKIAEDAPVVFMHDTLRLFPYWNYVKGYQYPVGAMFYEQRFDLYTMDTNNPNFRKNQGW